MPEEVPELQAPQPAPETEPAQQPGPQPVPNLPGGPAFAQTPPEPQPADDDKETALDVIRKIERARKSRVLVYWTTPLAKMSDGVIPSLYDQLTALRNIDHLDLVLHTGGGDTEIPWRMVSLIREFAKRFSVIVPHRAASAGTVLSMGADEIVMTRLAVLGPIDPSRGHPLLPGGREGEQVSVQDMRHAMHFIREAGQAEGEFSYTPEAMAQIFTALFDKLHPLAIGAIEQSYALSKLVATRCLETHMKGRGAKNEIARIVNKLCDDYKSHQYQIPRREAKDIGLKVKYAPTRLEDRIMKLYRHYASRPMVPPNVTPGVTYKAHIAWLDTTDVQLRCEANQQLTAGGKVAPLGDRWASY